MNLITVILLALGLCFDSFAVSLSQGIAQAGLRKMHFLRFSFVLAFFQGALALLGWSLASGLQHYIAQIDHWIAFGLLTFLGVRMIWEGRRCREKAPAETFRFDLKHTLLLGLATSIDSLITGAAMAMLAIVILPAASQGTNMLVAAGIIFGVTFIACVAGVFLGRTAGGKLGRYAELAGGIILVAIGVKILLEHLCGS